MRYKTITVEQVMGLEPRYSMEQVLELFGKRKRLTLLQVMELDISDEDKIWIGVRHWWNNRDTVELAVKLAKPSLKYTDDERVHKCYKVIEAWLDGDATIEAVRAAYAAAADAASAAYVTADAAADAARAAYVTADTAVYAGAYAGAYAAARAARNAYAAADAAADAARNAYVNARAARAASVETIKQFYKEKNNA